MKETLLKTMTLFIVFFVAVTSLIHLDKVCSETAGEESKLVLAVDNFEFLH